MSIKKKNKTDAKVVVFDIETTNLNADFGYILSACWMDILDRKVHTVRIDQFKGYKSDRTNDKALVGALADVLGSADVWVTWYGDRFDIPYVNTRLLWHGLDVMPPIPSVDGWRAARNHLKLSSNRLANISEFLDVERKTPVLGWQWVRAGAGHEDALNYVVEHNQKDVIVLGEVYDLIRPVIRNHPNINLVEHTGVKRAVDVLCPVCSGDKVHSRGYRIAKSRRSVRYQCQVCGSWFQGRPEPVLAAGVLGAGSIRKRVPAPN